MKKFLVFIAGIGLTLALVQPAAAQWAFRSVQTSSAFGYIAHADAVNGDHIVIGCLTDEHVNFDYLIPVEALPSDESVYDLQVGAFPTPATLKITIDNHQSFSPKAGLTEQSSMISIQYDPIYNQHNYLDYKLELKDPIANNILIQSLEHAQKTLTIHVSSPLHEHKSPYQRQDVFDTQGIQSAIKNMIKYCSNDS